MKLPGWITVQVVELAAVGVLAFLLVGRCNELAAAKAKAQKDAEAAELDKDGIQRAHETDLKAKNLQIKDLQKLVADLKARGIESTPIAVVTGTTGAVPVHKPTPIAQVGGAEPSGPAPAAPAQVTPPPEAGGPVCVLTSVDKGEVRVSAAAVRTKAGNVAVEGHADAYALEPERLLFGGPLHLDVSIPPLPASKGLGWGFGLASVVTRRGWSLGPALAIPPLTLWGLQLELSAGATLGGGGEWAGTATIVGRLRR